jgi:NDP-sugar pyrophosphorylase family protein
MNARTPKALILATGEGTRLRPLTLDRPKPMLPINGKPLLEHTIALLRRHGIQDIAINLHYCPEVIVKHVGDGSALGVHIVYSREDKILGTAGAARKLNGFIGNSPLVVVYGDVLTNLNVSALVAFHEHAVTRDPRTKVTLSLYHVSNPTEVGLVGMDDDGRITCFVEKPRLEQVFTDLANAGVLVIEPDAVNLVPPDTFYDFGLHLFPQLLKAGVPMYGWVTPDNTYLLDIGTPEKYAQAQKEWTW